ncbi:Crp/Fnr family transcriptional regulator [Flavicella sp.]|uniref:Crp/Fnr family transcriptional regulator n=1 Tax=Flavicella sp. TaxID=2957742 RepID=UPI002605B39E|nr:Crp/Fnr family transcriptional regulator [Flavicella sp.]MDG1804592.1 Crp/Fnr family transcriptional regulator [Flavicella sp.]
MIIFVRKFASNMGNCHQCIVKEFNSLRALSSEELKCVSSHKNEMSFKKGDVIFKEGMMLNGVYCIKEGKCKLTKLSPNGKEQIVKFIKNGDMLGYRSVLGEEPVNLSVVALEDMEACFIPKKDIFDSIQHNKDFSKDMFKVVCHDLKDANSTIANMAQKTVRERLADTLLFLDETFGEDEDGNINIKLSREEIANVIGTATESAIRLLSDLKKGNIISLTGKKIKIVNESALKKIGNGF